MRRKILPILLIILAAFAVYGLSLRNGFVWDDTALVLRDPFIRSWRLIPEGFRHFLFTDATASNFYRPIQRLTFTADYALRGFSAPFYHFTNVLLHGLAAVALFLFALELTRKRTLSFLAALIWVIHPLNSSAVIYVAGRADLLAALFGFGALWLALRNQRALAACGFLLALLSKESGFAFLLIWGLILLWRNLRVDPPLGVVEAAVPAAYPNLNAERAKKSLNPLRLAADTAASPLRWVLLLLAVIGAYCLLRFTAEHTEPPRFTDPAPLIARPLLMARAAALYTGLFIAPCNLHMERDVIALGPFASAEQARELEYLTLAGVALIAGLGFGLTRTQEPMVRLCFGCALIAYLPISNLFPLNATFAEHWFYIPGAFLLLGAGSALGSVSTGTAQRYGKIAGVLLGAWIVLLGARTVVRNADWKDPQTFISRTIADGGENSRMWGNLGGLELSQGNARAALACFQKAMKSPQPFATLGMASAEIKLGDYQNARAHIEAALKIPFIRPQALQDLAALEYRESGKDRIELLWEAADIAPENWGIQKKYLLHLAERGQEKEAIEALRHLLEDQPFRAESWKILGDLLLKEGQRQLAVEAYQEAALRDVHLKLGTP